MIYTICKEFRFEAAHRLPFHDGKCARLHGHSWKGRVYLQSGQLIPDGPKQGMVMDYGDVKKVLDSIIDTYLDHHYLNESLNLVNPTSEEVARWVFEHLLRHVWPVGVELIAVEIDETCTSSCRYERET